jgi:hypothetical protein
MNKTKLEDRKMTFDENKNILFSKVVCHFAHGEKCCKCKSEASDIRIEYPCRHTANVQERDKSIIEFFLSLVDIKNATMKKTDKIKPFCYPCHQKHSEENIPFAETGICVTFMGNGHSGVCRE